MVPSQRTDVEWASLDFGDPQISKYFKFSLKIRYKTKEEYDAEGPWAQFSARAEVRHFPMRLSRRVSLEREADLARAVVATPNNTIDLVEGELGGRERLFSSCLHTISKGKFAPVKVDNYELREFSMFHNPPLPFMRPGTVAMMTSSPPENSTDYFGYNIKECSKGCSRLSGVTILRFVEAENVPDRCRITVMAQGGVNIPSWMLPISLVAKIFSALLSAAFRNMASSICPNWGNLSYQKRIDSCPEFYGPLLASDEPARTAA
eukprot:gnl/TRDRNA2_/TRDRNA2_110677_c1_seq1.p1 gnl/TRDRNA2_/TRDRNA2_110677_c1~~gnl/TRDRNA2_/TRDRNA2_110677_c1_seq1.p1  ORF type:complete len:263 (-),score=25.64 gnl/TRDRNA2_/TRDRNA2_110677_c1_seq1:43-831(-)